MARKKTTKKPEDLTAATDAGLIAKDTAEADKLHQHLAEIDSTYGDGLPYDQLRIVNETRFYLQQSAEAMLEAGKRLVLLKEHEQHGEFTRCLEDIGVHPRAAQKMMHAAIKFTGAKRSLATVLGKSKLLELITEEDDDLEALADGRTLAGHTLDEIDRMSVRELREALRREKEQRIKEQEVSERLLSKKDEKINELDKTLHRLDHLPVDEQADELSQRLERATFRHIANLLSVEVVIGEIIDWEDAPQHLRNACQQSVDRIHAALDTLRAKWALTDHALTPEDDAWMEEFRKEQAALNQK